MTRERYARLEPFDVEEEKLAAVLATAFFSPINYQQMCQVIGKTPAEGSITPLSAGEFLKFLDKQNFLDGEANKCIYLVRDLLARLAAANILVEIGSGDRNVMMPKQYYALHENSTARQGGFLWLAKALGARFVHREVSHAIVHIVGVNEHGDPTSGTGVVLDSHHILTCRHVVCDMKLDQVQKYQGQDFDIRQISTLTHNNEDVAVIRVDGMLTPVPGLAFLAPTIAQTVYSLGYPKVPHVRPHSPDSEDAYLIMQRGEVTNERVVAASDKTELFLYSAISRPGNSGGAIISDDGYIIGISTNLTDGTYMEEATFYPHYAGIPSNVLANAILDLGLRLPYETFE